MLYLGCLAHYLDRPTTHREHAGEIRRAYGYRDFHDQPEHFQLVRWLYSLFGTSTLIVIAGTKEWDFEFRSNDKAHRAYEMILRNLLQGERRGMVAG